MKTCILAVLLIVVASSPLVSQTQQGSWEASLAATFSSVSQTVAGTSGDAQGILTMAVRPGIYVVDGLSIEPEFLWTAIEQMTPVFSIAGNLSYTLSLEQAEKIKPFALVGYGVGNGVPIGRMLVVRQSSDLDISLLNIGAGVKVFFVKTFALRVEYRYQRHGYTSGGGTDVVYNMHSVFMGFSVFFGR